MRDIEYTPFEAIMILGLIALVIIAAPAPTALQIATVVVLFIASEVLKVVFIDPLRRSDQDVPLRLAQLGAALAAAQLVTVVIVVAPPTWAILSLLVIATFTFERNRLRTPA